MSDVEREPAAWHDPPAPSERSTLQLAGDLTEQVSRLVRHEVELAREELSSKTVRAGMGAGFLGTAGVAALLCAVFLGACVAAALHLVLPLWLSILLVAVAYGMAAGVLALLGRDELERAAPVVPSQSIEAAKEDVAWIARRTGSGHS
jgi:hypothetical protein